MSIQDDETLQMYVEESLEHLADIENDLLAIEGDGADVDEELINKVFRAAHSVKGGAGFMGLDTIKELAHKMENILGMIRSREIVPNPEVINILLMAFDKLRELMNDVEHSNEVDISEHIVALNGLAAVSLPEEEKDIVSNMMDIRYPNGDVVFSVMEFDMRQAGKSGMFIYLVEYDLIHDVQNKGRTPLDVVREMQESGNILESKIDIASVGTLEGDIASLNRLPFLVLFASIIEMDIIVDVLGVSEERIHIVDKDMIARVSHSVESEIETEPENTEAQSSSEVESEGLLFESIVAKSEDTGVPAEEEPDPEVILKNEDKPTPIAQKGKQLETKNQHSKADTIIRVHVSLLDTLMTLAGELVLGRNQLLQTINSGDQHAVDLVGQKIDMVTSELQEAIMFTRMQPIGNVFNKFPRVVRDMAKTLGKEVDLILEGKEVELDKTIIEAISDPLTHLVRNSVDHGIELPDERTKAGKTIQGKVLLKAYHEAGQVNIEISDDGKGLDGNKLAASAVKKEIITEEQAGAMSKKEKINLIFMPGFSTAEKVTDVSGRGVGMDVVKTNLDQLGGVIDIDSQPVTGTRIRIKLPLTLAIIPSQIISVGGEQYAIPQVNIDELLRISADQVKDRIEKVGDAEVVRLREQLLPLVSLSKIMGIERTYIDPEDGVEKEDMRKNIADRRSKTTPMPAAEGAMTLAVDSLDPVSDYRITGHRPLTTDHDSQFMDRDPVDRRYHAGSAVNIVVVSTGIFKYGLVVDGLYDSEEIVVKPLGRHLKHCKGYAGATIMGDGRVALILDVAGLAGMAELSSLEGVRKVAEARNETTETMESGRDFHSLLVFMNGEENQFAVPLDLVARIEKIKSASIEAVSGKRVIQYRGGSLPLFTIDEVASVNPLDDRENFQVIVFKIVGREVGLLTTGPVDAMELSIEVDDSTLKQTGIMGSTIIGKRTTLLVNVFEIVETLNPDWFEEREVIRAAEGEDPTILLVEDSSFFRGQVKGFMETDGYNVIEAEDGMIAWDLLQENADKTSLVVTDIEMPNMDGLELTVKIKEDPRFSHLPVIAITSLAGEDDIARGKDAGIDDYQIKLAKEELMSSVYRHIHGK